MSLGYTIESILRQTVLPAEVIIVDDASSCGARRAAELLASSIGTVECRFKALGVNSGPGAARNAGWEMARQPILAFVDADDSWFPQKIEMQSALLLGREGLEAVGHPMLVGSRIGGLAERSIDGRDVGFKGLLQNQWLWRNRFATSSVMLRREIPFRFGTDSRHSEDFDLWLRMAFAGKRMAIMDTALGMHHKAKFGDSGLSSDLWGMERGELKAFHSLCRAGLISNATLAGAASFSLTKYLVRLLRVNGRRILST